MLTEKHPARPPAVDLLLHADEPGVARAGGGEQRLLGAQGGHEGVQAVGGRELRLVVGRVGLPEGGAGGGDAGGGGPGEGGPFWVDIFF